MDYLKFLKSFNTKGTYLFLAVVLLIFFVIYFYVINPT
ncbi:MAG: hypothetical protein ACN6NV_10615 [Acinetobacter gandensis]